MGSEPSPRRSPAWFFPAFTLLACSALITGALVSNEFRASWGTIVFFHWGWNGIRSSTPLHQWWSIPGALACLSLGTLALRRRKLQGAIVAVLTGLALAAAVIETSLAGLWVLRTWIEMISGAALIAAGNHVLKVVPDRRLPRVIAALGGLRLFASYLTREDYPFSEPILYALGGWHPTFESNPVAAIFAWLLLGYAVLGILWLFARRPYKRRAWIVSALGYLLLVLFPLGLAMEDRSRSSLVYGGEGDVLFQAYLNFFLKFWLLGMGLTLLLAVGVATWMEEFLVARDPRSTSPPTLTPSGS